MARVPKAAFAILLLAVLWLISWGSARWLIVEAPLPHADVAVLLSGSSTYFERAQTAATLFRAGKVSRIILTNDNRQGGWSSAEQRNPFFYERTKRELERQGVPETSIEVLSQTVYSTYDEAKLLRDYNATHPFNRLVVVTSPYHSRRAYRTFRRMFNDTNVQVGIEHPPTGIQSPQPGSWWLKPRGWQMVPYEYVKLVYYWFRL
ncbi:MAG TPA: YdcF family protein [Pyrinomonadaceae bacterium]